MFPMVFYQREVVSTRKSKKQPEPEKKSRFEGKIIANGDDVAYIPSTSSDKIIANGMAAKIISGNKKMKKVANGDNVKEVYA